MSGNQKKETIYLYLVQISNMVVPLLIIPYLTSVFGVEFYGKLSYAQVISLIALFFVDFGFNYSAAKSIGANKDSQILINKIFTNVQCIKIVIYLMVVFTFLSITLLFKQDEIDNDLLLIGALSSISSIVSPLWLFQGIGKISLVAIPNLIVRLLSLVFIFTFIHERSDIILAAFIQLCSPVLAGVFVMFLLRIKKIATFDSGLFSYSFSKTLVSESFHNFSASFLTLGFTYFNPLVIKYFLGDFSLGLYSLADKLVNVLRQLYNPIVQANFSQVCMLYKQERIVDVTFKLRKIFIFFLSLSLLALGCNFIAGEYILRMFFARGYEVDAIKQVNILISIMIFTQFIISISIILVNLIIVPSGNSHYLKRVYALAFMLYIFIIYLMVKFGGVYGVALTITIVEFFIIILFSIFVSKKKLVEFS
ncbi:oligosaccharide flippase family protein [Raoultella ornithinolytica]|uniref:oligosaccharide flippase family protein n=2 Tax=Raoultella ornithinolytica TaxID=54291 RepID=UPI001265BC4D|nr:oligosaccharide flippase family protein [Raoultella ornithinolytica]KAB8169424.1 oligosaccharide flippase family protein [Raoultella ornithinolytica]QWU11862.1 oligosaccharide flippase family protein [Raoultella ornithinolytica]